MSDHLPLHPLWRRLNPPMLGCALALMLPPLLSAHGRKGERDVAVFDLSAASSVPEAVARAASNGVEGAFSAGASSAPNECITLKPNRMRLVSTMALFPMPRDFAGNHLDYAVWGELTGTAGAYRISLRFSTAASRALVASATTTFEKAEEAASAGAVVASELIRTGGHIREAVRLFEVARRSQNTDFAMGPSLSVRAPKTALEMGESVSVDVELKDCDGAPLGQRQIEPRVGDGKASPLQVLTGGNGTAQFTYTAPGKTGNDHVDAHFMFTRPSDRPGESLREGLGIKVIRPAEYEPAVWNASVVIRRAVDGKVKTWENVPAPFGASSRVYESIDPLRVEFKINRHRRAIPGEKASYNWKYEMVTTRSGSPFVSQKGAETGTKLGFQDVTWVNGWEFTLKRTLRPAEGIPELNVNDEDGPAAALFAQIAARREELLPGEAPENKCVLEAKATFPGQATTVNAMSGETEKADSRPVVEESVTIQPYRFDQRQHIKLVELPLAEAGPDLGTSKRSFMYDLTFLPKFDFERSDFVVSIDGEDFTEKFKVRKFWREWMTPNVGNDLNSTRKGSYTRVADWETGPDPMPNLFALAQQLSRERSSDPALVWPTLRRLREYLVQVEEFPEMGFFYYIDVWTTEPPQIFRAYRYQPIRITAEQWRNAKLGKQPFRTEENAGPVINSFR